MENRFQAFSRLLERIEKAKEPFESTYQNDESVVEDTLSILRPFLLNAERHQEHARMLIEHALKASTLQAFSKILIPIFNSRFLQWVFRPLTEFRNEIIAEQQKFQDRIRELREELLAQADPGQIRIDILPLRSLDTHRDWLKQDKRLIQVETRTAVYPGKGLALQSVSHLIQVLSPKGSQFVDAIPSTTVESIGTSEWSVSSKGKFIQTETTGSEIGVAGAVGIAKAEAKVKSSAGTQQEIEVGGSRMKMRTDQQHSVINSTIDDTVQWELLRTPSQVLEGGNNFLASLLVPIATSLLELRLDILTRTESWGPAAHNETRILKIPELEISAT